MGRGGGRGRGNKIMQFTALPESITGPGLHRAKNVGVGREQPISFLFKRGRKEEKCIRKGAKKTKIRLKIKN